MMLLLFEVENYKSFKDRTVFSMEPAPKQKGLDYSILKERIGNKNYKGLSAVVIYGPNASGKTNIIGAMQTLKNIVIRGNIKNSKPSTPNIAEGALELIPNNTYTESKPVFFLIKFIDSNMLIEYSLLLDLGTFLDDSYTRSILNEKLLLNEKIIFERDKNGLSLDNLKYIKTFLVKDFFKSQQTATKIAQQTLDKEELFLTNGFKNIVSPNLANSIINFFSHQINTLYQTNELFATPSFKNDILEDTTINAAAKEFGINSNKLIYVKDENQGEPILCSLLNTKAIPSAVFESYGTIRFVNIFPALVNALKLGATLVIDEFDASIHPMAIMSIIDIFHNDEINKKHAQLIFNTHNPLYLNNNLFRRDEIKFVERDDETKCSHHYSLSDFGTSGTKARKGKDYMKNYFVNEYGAIRDIDFTSVFENIMKGV